MAEAKYDKAFLELRIPTGKGRCSYLWLPLRSKKVIRDLKQKWDAATVAYYNAMSEADHLESHIEYLLDCACL